MKRQRQFGELEFAILQAVPREGRVTVRDVQRALGGKLRYTTVMTVMSRLWQKGELKRARAGRRYEYWAPAVPTRRSAGLLQRILRKIFNDKLTALVAYLIESRPTSAQELCELELLISRARSRI